MKFLNRINLIAIFIISVNIVYAQLPYNDFEIVESIPLETTLDNPDIRNTFDVWLEMIGDAQSTIDIEQFYISNEKGEALEPIIRAIEKAADRGVEVRIIAEEKMSKTYPETLERFSKHRNIQVRLINVFGSKGGVQHSKYFIVDRRQVFIGSQNFDWRALDHIHELGLRINHVSYAQKMTELFELDWNMSRGEQKLHQKPSRKVEWLTIAENGQETVRFTASASPIGFIPPSFELDLDQILGLINNSRKKVYVQLLSYSPSVRDGDLFTDLDDALRSAAKRGVDVRLLCSDWCQKPYEIPYLKKLAQLPNINVKLSTIPEWSGAYIPFSRVEHCKFMVVDDSLSWLGTSNWHKDYFYNSRNVAVVIRNTRINTMLSQIFLKSWNGPYSWKVDPERKYRPKYYGEKN